MWLSVNQWIFKYIETIIKNGSGTILTDQITTYKHTDKQWLHENCTIVRAMYRGLNTTDVGTTVIINSAINCFELFIHYQPSTER